MSLWHTGSAALVSILGEVSSPTLEKVYGRPRWDGGNQGVFASLFRDTHGRIQHWWVMRPAGEGQFDGTYENTTHEFHIIGRLSFDDAYPDPIDGYSSSIDWFEAAIDAVHARLVRHVQMGSTSGIVVRQPPRWVVDHEASWRGQNGIHEVDFTVLATVIRNFTAEA